MGRIKAGVYRGERVEAAAPGRRGATGAWGFCPAVAGEIAVDFGWAWAWRARKIRELEAGMGKVVGRAHAGARGPLRGPRGCGRRGPHPARDIFFPGWACESDV